MTEHAANADAVAAETLGRARRLTQRVTRLLHAILGAPDYERYLAHERACHPDHVPLSRDEFVRERLTARYERPGARCC